MEETICSLETIVHRLKHSHESLRIYMEMELANRDLTIGVLRACVNALAPMEVDLTTKEYISAPTSPSNRNTSTTNILIRIETPDLIIPEGVLIPIEDDDEEEGEVSEDIPDESEAPEPLGIHLLPYTFNWQDEAAQGWEEYYCQYVPPPLYEDMFPDVVRADNARYLARANTAKNSNEDFSDLGINNFVLSHKVTTHRKLEHLQGNVFNKSLLERGMYHVMEGIKVYNGPLEVSMGYTSSVGVMLAEEIAFTNDLVGAISMLTQSFKERIGNLVSNVEGLECMVQHLKRSHEALKIHTELELSAQDLTIGVLWAQLNAVAPMEVDLVPNEEEEEISPPVTNNTSTTNLSGEVWIRIETPDLSVSFDQGEVLSRSEVPVGVLIPIEDVIEEEIPEPVGIHLPTHSFNWQDEAAQCQEAYYSQQREEEDRARLEPEYVPPPMYDNLFPDMIRADQVQYSAWYLDGRLMGKRGPLDGPVAGPSGVPRDD
ncbi:hypothetical protein BDM02DRAFT_3193039 [Thelephora ganbajun]|uniref:Uncharacterized protein n=1 Tax=Thelephora ganbajun TaxID=370292 RepID=A0ACB6YZ66_THEGA|nr:hypothetical protein BDM02DRAFT_3193039 [Thelephora ganbajun]